MAIMDSVKPPDLPAPLHWYSISHEQNGVAEVQWKFPLYGVSGAIAYGVMCVIVDHFNPSADGTDLGYGLNDDARGKWYSLRYYPETSDFDTALAAALKELGY